MNKVLNNLATLPVLAFRWTRVHVVPVVTAPYDYFTGFVAGIRDFIKSPK